MKLPGAKVVSCKVVQTLSDARQPPHPVLGFRKSLQVDSER